MIRRFSHSALVALVLCTLLASTDGARGGHPALKKATRSLKKTLTNDTYGPILINTVFNYYANNGDGSFNPYSTDNEGFEFPKGSGGHIVFDDGVAWGGFHAGMLKVGGSTYDHGLQAGRIVISGTSLSQPVAEDPSSTANRLYRVRRDVTPSTAFDHNMEIRLDTSEVRLTGRYQSVTAQQIYQQYIADWNEWPASEGAPFQDVNGDGIYNPAVDIPGVPGSDQTLWYVANDLDSTRSLNLYGSPPIGIEMQRTIWAYNRSGYLGWTVFLSTRIINKSGLPIDSMFITQWADPDLGGSLGATDNYSGCDTTRAMGYIYNGTACNPEPVYGCSPPAGGYILLQGPAVPGAPNDSARIGRGFRRGYRNLPMTSFVFFVGGSAIYSDPMLNDYRGTLQYYNYMNGRVGSTGAPFIDPTTGMPTKFPLAGDPASGSGFLEASLSSPGDQRIMLSSGPISMASGDTQEVVVATTAARAGDRLSSVALLRSTADWIHHTYNGGGLVGRAPEAPVVQAAELDGQIVLSWGDPVSAGATETPIYSGYVFQGYNVYQSGGQAFENPVLLAVYDVVDGVGRIKDYVTDPVTGDVYLRTVRFGRDSGIQRYFQTRRDSISGSRLLNGTPYYFAVTAYNYNPDTLAFPRTFESEPTILRLIPQAAKPGTRYAKSYGDPISPVLQIIQPGVVPTDAVISPVVIDPTQLTGHTYRITFDTSKGSALWSLADTSAGRLWFSRQALAYRPVIDGMLITLQEPHPGMSGFSGGSDWTWQGGPSGLEGFGGAIGNAHDHWSSGGVSYFRLRNVVLREAATDDQGNLFGTNDPNASVAYRYLANASLPPAQPAFAPFIAKSGPGFAFQDFKYTIPLAAFDLDTTPVRRLAVGFLENNVAGGLVDGKYWPPIGTSYFANNVDSTGPREWLFVFDEPYSTIADPALEVDIRSRPTPLMWFATICREKTGGLSSADSLEILAAHLITAGNSFTFTSPRNVLGDVSVARADVSRITVFPNPYFANNPQEAGGNTHFVTFYHLPQKAIIRIYNLAGWLVRTLVKDDQTQLLQWDLLTEHHLYVGGGIFIVRIEMPELGTTKILKLAVIPGVYY